MRIDYIRLSRVSLRMAAHDCITMSAPLDASSLRLISSAEKEPECGSYAGQLGTGHGVP
jgi:hypothetical protein